MVMIIQILLLKSSPFLLGNGRGDGHDHTEPSSEKLSFSFGKVNDGDHGHTEPSVENIASSSGKGKGW